LARRMRIDFPGCWHHVFNRGTRKETVFRVKKDYEDFIALLDETCRRFGIEVHAYALMPNHYHLLVRSVHAELSNSMKLLIGTFTQRVNRRNGWDGPLFRGRFKNVVLETDARVACVAAYIHLNPVRARLVSEPELFPWSSFAAYMQSRHTTPWLTRDWLLSMHGSPEKLEKYVEDYRKGRLIWPDDLYSVNQGKTTDKNNKPIESDCAWDVDSWRQCICSVIGRPWDRVIATEKGRAGNLARVFALEALVLLVGMSCFEAGKQVNLSAKAVSNVINRHRSDAARHQLDRWMFRLMETKKIEEKGGSDPVRATRRPGGRRWGGWPRCGPGRS